MNTTELRTKDVDGLKAEVKEGCKGSLWFAHAKVTNSSTTHPHCVLRVAHCTRQKTTLAETVAARELNNDGS
jgi:hypothetical protein